MDEVVGKHEVDASIHVGRHSEVVLVAVHEGMVHTMVLIENRCDAVEAESVEFVLLKPEAEVGEQEAKHLPGRVVVDSRIPQRVVALWAFVKVLVCCTID